MKKESLFISVLITILLSNIFINSFSQNIGSPSIGDTMYIRFDEFKDENLKYDGYSDLLLTNEPGLFSGYLVLKFDIDKTNIGSGQSFEVNNSSISVFWIDSFDDLYKEDCYFYYFPMLRLLIDDGEGRYLLGDRNDLSVFCHYLRLFNKRYWLRKSDCLNYMYLGSGLLTYDSLLNKSYFKRSDDKSIYLFFKTFFDGATIQFKSSGKRILIPTSILYEFEPLEENSVVEMKSTEDTIRNLGFNKINLCVKLKL